MAVPGTQEEAEIANGNIVFDDFNGIIQGLTQILNERESALPQEEIAQYVHSPLDPGAAIVQSFESKANADAGTECATRANDGPGLKRCIASK